MALNVCTSLVVRNEACRCRPERCRLFHPELDRHTLGTRDRSWLHPWGRCRLVGFGHPTAGPEHRFRDGRTSGMRSGVAMHGRNRYCRRHFPPPNPCHRHAAPAAWLRPPAPRANTPTHTDVRIRSQVDDTPPPSDRSRRGSRRDSSQLRSRRTWRWRAPDHLIRLRRIE